MGDKSFIGIFVGFVVLAVLFFIIERVAPSIKGQPVRRKGFWTDVIYWFFTPLVTKGITKVALIIPVVLFIVATGITAEELKSKGYYGYGPLAQQPGWLQAIEVFILGDFIGYWMHRFFHGARLWKFHAVHHSSEQVDWLSSVRLHPVNDVVTRLAQVFPFLFLGFRPDVLLAYAPILAFYAILLHANVNWDYGPLRAVIASPVFHRWHHTKEHEAMDKNFAGFFPFWDIVFGTYYMPKGKVPTEFGIEEKMPEGLVGQLAFPFQRASPTAETAQPEVPIHSSRV